MQTITDIPDIPTAVKLYLVDKFERWPVRTNRASALPHPCLRHLVYHRTRWAEAQAPSPTLLSIFKEGELHETAVIRAIEEAGYTVLRQQQTFDWKEHNITGRIDGMIATAKADGIVAEGIPFDVKSCSSYTFDEIQSVDTLRNARQHWVRGWYDQLVLYCIMSNKEHALLILKNKATGELKQVVIPLDYVRAEELVQKADAINRHVAMGTLPDRIPYDQDICGRCDFFGTCLPNEALMAGARLVDDPELEQKLRRRAELEATAKEYNRIDTEIKEQVKATLDDGQEEVVGTDWLLKVSVQQQKGYTVDAFVKRIVKIQRIGRTAETPQ